MSNYNDERVGKTINIYDILYLCDYKSNDGHKVYHIRCNECGWENDVQFRNIKNLSPTCIHKNVAGSYINFNRKLKWKNQRLRRTFEGMCSRCYNETTKDYRFYGARGIRICKEWLDNPTLFEDWAYQNGYTDTLTIDRIDSNKDYCPENCQWIPLEENSRKAGDVHWITVKNITLTGRQWSERLGLGVNSVNTFIRKYGVEKTKELIVAILNDPILNHNRKPKQSWFNEYGIQI